MLKYVSKFAMDILPSVVATIIGAYIVNHYIVSKPGAAAPVAAAVSTADPKVVKADVRATETSNDVANIPQPGVRAKGISEKAIIERSAAEKPTEKSSEKAQEKAQEKPADNPAETAAIPADTRRHPREKAIAKVAPAPVQSAAPATVPVVTTSNAAPAEVALPAEEHRDANDLARAAIERLRATGDGVPHTQEAARTPDPPAPRVADAPRVVTAPPVAVLTPSIRPLPPPIMVSTPAGETLDPAAGPSQVKPQPYASAPRFDDPRRPTPPADIPVSGPLDLRAEAGDPSTREHTTVAEDMLLAAKSVFHAVLPK